MITVKDHIKLAARLINEASLILQAIREREPTSEPASFVDAIHPSLLTVKEACEAEAEKTYDFPDGRAIQVTSIFRDIVFARSVTEASRLHMNLIKQWASEDTLQHNCDIDSEPAQCLEDSCVISFKGEVFHE